MIKNILLLSMLLSANTVYAESKVIAKNVNIIAVKCDRIELEDEIQQGDPDSEPEVLKSNLVEYRLKLIVSKNDNLAKKLTFTNSVHTPRFVQGSYAPGYSEFVDLCNRLAFAKENKITIDVIGHHKTIEEMSHSR